MKRRTLLQAVAAAAASPLVPLRRVAAQAAPRELTPDAISLLNEIALTVLPSALGAVRVRTTVDRFVAWTRGYQEGIALAHGYGHPRLQKSGPSPVPRYIEQLNELRDAARSAQTRGTRRDGAGAPDRWSSLDLETRRALLDAALTKANIRNLPQRPAGQHVIADLMAFYFRSSEANDECYKAMIGRETCRTIALTVRKPEPRA